MKKILSTLLACMMAATLFTGCSSGEPQQDTSGSNSSSSVSNEGNGDHTGSMTIEEGKLIVGVDDSFAPMGFRDENNEIVGFDIDLANAVGEKMGLEVVIQPIDWSAKILELQGGKVDVLWNGFTITEERKQEVAFTDPYLANNQVIITTVDSDITDRNGLEGKEVGIQAESSAIDALQQDPVAEKIANLHEYADNALAISDLKIGRVDAVVTDEVLANYYASQDRSLKVLSDSFMEEEYGVGVKKENTALLEALQKALDEVISDGTGTEISNKWFGEDKLLK